MIELKVIGDGCAGKECPTVYQGSDGMLYIQGFKIPSELRDRIRCGSDEDVVRITPALIEVIKKL